jgi:hypothetical protein
VAKKKRRDWRRHWLRREPWESILYLVAWALPVAAAVATLLQLVRKFWP